MWVKHTRCPACFKSGRDRHGDNLGVYPDGGKFCFSCGYRESRNSLNLDQMVRQAAGLTVKADDTNAVKLPSDFTHNIPARGLDWIKLYGITDAEIELYKVGWSELYERVIFPVYDAGHLIMWHGRLCPLTAAEGRPKGITEGFKERAFYILGDTSVDSCILVEDVVSAIKVSRHMPAMPIWGSVISTNRLIGLQERYGHISIWLDYDKREYAAKRAIYARQFLKSVKVITTQFDPKAYNDEAIAQYVHQQK